MWGQFARLVPRALYCFFRKRYEAEECVVKVLAWVTKNSELSMSQFPGASLCGCHQALLIAGVLLCWFEAEGSCC